MTELMGAIADVICAVIDYVHHNSPHNETKVGGAFQGLGSAIEALDDDDDGEA